MVDEKIVIILLLAWVVFGIVEVFGGELNPVYGIGIIPNIREKAAAYFKQLELDQQKQAIEAQKIVEYQDNNIIFLKSTLCRLA